jgi:23S rRNA (cytidine1920-2'-O)/16S rRNA (cytidine1409-2'-O)-methyltransferase
MNNKERIDLVMVQQGLAESREKAKRLVYAGEVWMSNQRVNKPGVKVDSFADIYVQRPPSFVSRGGEKLDYAVKYFNLNLQNKVCIDIGSSTGGFTDCMLKHGAKKVYAIDSGTGQLHWKLRQDSRVELMEKTNVRYLKPCDIPIVPDFASVDVSFISLTKVLPVLKNIVKENAEIVTLIKPQFEAERKLVSKGGVVRDSKVHSEICAKIKHFGTIEVGLQWVDCITSPLKGPAGNTEFLAFWKII